MNILIFGICRSGKSTFSKKIYDEFSNCQIIEVDTILAALQESMNKKESIGFIHDNIENNCLPIFLNSLLRRNNQKCDNEYNFVVNADSIMPRDLIKYFDLEKTIVYYFVNPSLSPFEILNNCRKYDKETEWTYRKSDEEILQHLQFYKKVEREIIDECKQYGFRCIDTSENREEIFFKLMKELKSVLR